MFKTIIIKLYPTKYQCKKLDEFIDTGRYVYNRTLEYIKKFGYEPYFEPLRNLLATERTRSNYLATKCYSMYMNTLYEKRKN